MVHMRGTTERSPLLPIQRGQRDYEAYSEKRPLEFESYTALHGVHKHDHGSNNPFTPIYAPIVRRNSLETTRRHLNQLLLPSAVLTLLLTGYLIALCRNSHGEDPRILYARPADSDNYDSGASFAPFATQKLWAAYSPYYSVEEYQPPPNDCRLTQVNILQRHGARYPTFGQSVHIAQALLRLQAAESYTDENFQFIADYQYDLGIDDLLPFGAYQTSESGRKSFVRYSTLADKSNLPFVRASGSERVIQSALKWIEGFSAGSGGIVQPSLNLIIPEKDGYNNTLDDGSCPNVGHPIGQVQEWQSIYAQPIADRLTGATRGMPENLTAEDAQALIALCALETVAKEEYSRFCGLFSQEEFEGFEYALDLDKFYFTGHGSPLGPVQGVGYINELLARLTDKPVRDYTQTNWTLDSNPDTFPLGRGMYVDFSHDNLIVAVVSAMGLFGNSKEERTFKGGMLDPAKPDGTREWFVSRIVPFSGRMVVERMECGLPTDDVAGYVPSVSGKGRQRKRAEDAEDSAYVRILVNDAVQDLEFCKGVGEDGLCPLHAFVKSQAYARRNGEGDWEKCFE